MRLDISFLPALAAAFMLAFARIGAMVMLLPGLGESNIPVRVKLSIALLLTLIVLPLHRQAYHVDMTSMTSLLVLMLHEIVIGIILGATAREAVGAAGRRFHYRPAGGTGLRHLGRSDPGPAGRADRQLPDPVGRDHAVCDRQPPPRHRGAQRQLQGVLARRDHVERRRRLAGDAG